MTISFTLLPQVDALVGAIAPDTIVSRTILNQPEVRVVLFGFAPGQELSEHTAARTAILHVLRGSAQLTLAGEPQRAEAGSLVHMPPHMPHSVLAESETVMLLYLVGT